MSKDISVTMVGSFRKDPAGLKRLYEKLSSRYNVLSPVSIDWQNSDDEFVKTASEKENTIKEIEERHLDAIRRSDFIVVCAPDGYIGSSGAFEIGFAHALGIPIITTEQIEDPMLTTMVDGQLDKANVPVDYGKGLKALQYQYATIARSSGWEKESARDTMLLLTEEVGELARAVRKHAGIKRDGNFKSGLEDEIADVQIYLAHLANTTNIDLGYAVTKKIRKNQQKSN